MFKKQRIRAHAWVSAAVAIALLTVSMPVLAADPVSVSGGSILSLPPANIVTIAAGSHADYQDLRIAFPTVTADGRCPVGVSCASPGNATVQLRVTQLGTVMGGSALLALNTSTPPVSGTFGNWRITVTRLIPAPTVQAPKPTAGQYQVSLRLEKTLPTAPVAGPGVTVSEISTATRLAAPRATGGLQTVDATSLSVSAGQSAEFGGRQIKFVSVVSDSRCPSGVTCVTAGNAKIRLRVTREGTLPADVDINSSDAPTSVDVAGLTLRFTSLTPLPTATGKPDPSAYKLVLNAQTTLRY